MSTKKKLSAKERIRRGGPPTRTHTVWLGADLDLIDQYEAAVKELEAAQEPSDSLAGGGSTADITARIESLREQLDEYAMDFRLRGMDDKRWVRLLAEHPPRKTDDGEIEPTDRPGWDAETFPPALVRAATVSPELDDEDWLNLLGGIRKGSDGQDEEVEGSLTGAQVDELAAVAFSLSRTSVAVPFWRAASPSQPTSGRE